MNKTRLSSTATEMEVRAGAALKEEKKKGKVSSFYTNFANNTSYVTGANNIKNNTTTITTITDPLFDRKFDDATSGLEPFLANTLNDIYTENLGSIINYLLVLRTEINLSDNYRRLNIVALCKFSNK